jgi:MFS transporter, ACS family, tartrate transporter
MSSQVSTAGAKSDPKELDREPDGESLVECSPFVFLLYIVNYIDRVNVSFANLRMSADLGFSDRVCGLGVGMFYIAYVLFEIPGAIIVERWRARKWIARIMICNGNGQPFHSPVREGLPTIHQESSSPTCRFGRSEG